MISRLHRDGRGFESLSAHHTTHKRLTIFGELVVNYAQHGTRRGHISQSLPIFYQYHQQNSS